jgi:hypothetical protein
MAPLRSRIFAIVGTLVLQCAFTSPLLPQSIPTGSLHLTAGTGGGRLTVDGRFVGELKPSGTHDSPAIQAGRHTVRLEKEGYFPVEEELVVRPGTRTDKTLSQQRSGPEPVTGPSTIDVVLNNGETYDFDRKVKATGGGDVMWVVIGTRHLIPQLPAKLALLGKTSCEMLSLDVLKAQPYSGTSIRMGDGADELDAGTVLAVTTKGDNYACVRVVAINVAITMSVTMFQ